MRHGTALLALLLEAGLAHGAPSVIARAGDPSPLGLPFSRFSEPAVDDRGRVAFVGGSTVLFTRTAAGIRRVAGADDVLAGRRVAGVGPPTAGPDGCLAFRAGFTGGGAAIFLRCGETPVLVVATGDPAPGGGTFVGLGNDVVVGPAGRIGFSALGDGGSTGLFVADGPGAFTEVARTGMPSPSGGTFSSLRPIGVSAAGRVGFRGAVSGGPDGLFSWEAGTILPLAVVGAASPAGGSFQRIGQGAMNDAEAWVFRASVSTGEDAAVSGFFRALPTASGPLLETVVLDGDATPIGGTFSGFPTALVPAINSSGAIAFRATLADAPFPAAVFVARPDGTLVKAAAVREPTGAGQLVRLRELALADDGGVVIRASLIGGTPGLFRAQGGDVTALAVLGDTTDLGGGFRFTNAAARATADTAAFLGVREGMFVADASGALQSLALLGERTPLRGEFAGFDPPAAGGGRLVFGASIQHGRAGEALLADRRGALTVVAKVGDRVRPCGVIADLFANPLDDLARAGVGPATVAFHTALAGAHSTSGIVLWNGRGLRALACQGRTAPGGGRFQAFGTPDAGSAGLLAFVGIAAEPNGTLFRVRGGRTTVLAVSGRPTRTRLPGLFRGFDTPTTTGTTTAFRALLDQGREGVFIARGRCTMALAGSGEPEPGGGRFRSFGAPAFVGESVVFRAATVGGPSALALYRATPSGFCTQEVPPIETLALAGSPSPAGPAYVDFGVPAGNRKATLAFAADLTGAGPQDAIVVDQR